MMSRSNLAQNQTGEHLKNLIGKRFGKLTVLTEAKPTPRSLRFGTLFTLTLDARCDCGNVVSIPLNRLTSRRNLHCSDCTLSNKSWLYLVPKREDTDSQIMSLNVLAKGRIRLTFLGGKTAK